jgi:hypothetical protein
MQTRRLVLFLATMALMLGLTATGGAQTTECTVITELPTIISTPGLYCLNSDLAAQLPYNAKAITIEADSVILDLHGHSITATLPANYYDGTQYGVYASEHKNITIRNGEFRGFCDAIGLLGDSGTSGSHVVQDIRTFRSRRSGITAHGSGNVIRHNQVIDTVGNDMADGVGVFGIRVYGPDARVVDNDVAGVKNASAGGNSIATYTYGIYFDAAATNGIAFGNRVTGGAPVTPYWGEQYGYGTPITTLTDYGIYMNPRTVKYRENVVTGATYRFSGGTSAGDNY